MAALGIERAVLAGYDATGATSPSSSGSSTLRNVDGDASGIAPATDGSTYAAHFSGKHTHRVIPCAGHNLPQEAPQAFIDAVVEADGFSS
jgi:hypothetical protein